MPSQVQQFCVKGSKIFPHDGINDCPHLHILHNLKQCTGFNIREWARANGFNREVVYQSAEGAGSRKIRVKLATVLGKYPSELWPQRNPWVKRRDDEAYQLEVERNTPIIP